MGRPRPEVDAARRHAQGCETCGAAAAADAALLAEMRTLSSSVGAPDLTAMVMARIERTEAPSLVDQRHRDTAVAPWWLLAASALTVGVVLTIWGPRAVGDLTAQLPPSARGEAARDMRQPALALINIALYVAVLLMPLLTRGVKSRRTLS